MIVRYPKEDFAKTSSLLDLKLGRHGLQLSSGEGFRGGGVVFFVLRFLRIQMCCHGLKHRFPSKASSDCRSFSRISSKSATTADLGSPCHKTVVLSSTPDSIFYPLSPIRHQKYLDIRDYSDDTTTFCYLSLLSNHSSLPGRITAR